MRVSVENKIALDLTIEGENITKRTLINFITGNSYTFGGYEFAISYKVKESLFAKCALITDKDMRIVATEDEKICYEGEREGVRFCVDLIYEPDESAGVIRKRLSVKVEGADIFVDYIELDSMNVSDAQWTWTIPVPTKRVYTPCYVVTEGQPYYVEDMFFGGEFPVADNRIAEGIASSKYHIGRRFSEIAENGTYNTIPFVMGSGIGARFDMMRTSFFRYVSTFARPAHFRVQYNSWYDNMLDINSDIIEKSFREVADGFKKAGYRPLDCYVVDDGWIDYKTPTFWEFDSKKFPNKFDNEKKLMQELGSKFGVWFGPRGGYTTQTVKYAKLLKKIGYNVCKQSFDICTGDPHYIHDLCAKMADFCKTYDVTYYKIDGFAITPCHASNHGHPKGKGDGLYFYTFLWEEWAKGFEMIREACPDVFLNITSYAHPSPWFLKWCDAVWINNCGDMGYEGGGSNLNQCLCYRDNKYMDFFEERELQFPTAYIYNHEPCYAERNYNPPLPNPSHKTVKYTYEEFEEYMYMCMMRGTGFVELYFSPSMFDDKRWSSAAKVLTWAEEHFDILKNSQFFGADPSKGNVYGYYAIENGRAIMSIRNSSAERKTYTLINKDRCYDDAPYDIRQYYPVEGDATRVGKGETYDIELAPYESRIYYIDLIK